MQDRYLTLTPITFSGKLGSRLDIVIKFRTPKKSTLTGKTVGLQLAYQLDCKEEDTWYKSTY